MKSDPFAPSAAIRLVDKIFAFEKPLPALEWLADLDAKLGIKKVGAALGKFEWERPLRALK